ncbi:MAG: tryptophan--tRNA ligase [Bacteroidia bacterium]|nr:MAG: tryptophan--tRNA ligase [Bacteroidia bacterium]
MANGSKPIVVSGIRSTGKLHLGNYLGALKNFVAMQEEFNCFFFIADLHSLTTHPTSKELHASVRQVMAEYLAAGLDPQKCSLYVQSDVPEVVELYLFLNMNAYLGELQRCTSFKDKVRKQPENINAGLLTYPTLMAADILQHRANIVPVGKDQEQHLEMARTFGNRFNRMYEVELFPEPQSYTGASPLVKIPGLDGSGKMGKSEGNAIYLSDSPEVIRKKVMKAQSDNGPTQPKQAKSEAIENLFTLMRHVSTPDTLKFFEEAYDACSIRYGDMKKQLAEDMIAATAPIRERIEYYMGNASLLTEAAAQGAARASESSRETLRLVKEAVGIKRL